MHMKDTAQTFALTVFWTSSCESRNFLAIRSERRRLKSQMNVSTSMVVRPHFGEILRAAKVFSTFLYVACVATNLSLRAENLASRESFLKPRPNDQTLFVKHLKFAICFTVWPRRKNMLVKHFCLRQGKIVFAVCQKNAGRILLKGFVTWPNVQKLL